MKSIKKGGKQIWISQKTYALPDGTGLAARRHLRGNTLDMIVVVVMIFVILESQVFKSLGVGGDILT